ncbi:MAG: plasmid partitioning protein RepB C-terminal domain-containing protein [Terracidiphilus sp.]|jgi:hypothetical protein
MKVATIGLDIAKQVFQIHGADKAGRTVLRRRLRRKEVARFFSEQPPCLVGIEASGSAYYWARVLGAYTYNKRVNYIPPVAQHLMLLQTLNRGVSEERIAAALNVDVYAVRQKAKMLDGICDEVVGLLRDRKMSPELFQVLRKMKPAIQIATVELMILRNNLSVAFAKTRLALTPPDLLNVTSVLVKRGCYGTLKTRIAEDWAMLRGFRVRRIDRRLDANLFRNPTEPGIALAGLDRMPARRLLGGRGFEYVIDAGLGAMVTDYRNFRLNVFDSNANPSDHFADVEDGTAQVIHDLMQLPAYKQLVESSGDGGCGAAPQRLVAHARSTELK